MLLRALGILAVLACATAAQAGDYHGPGEQGGGYVYPSYNGGWSLSPYASGISTYHPEPPLPTYQYEPVAPSPSSSTETTIEETLPAREPSYDGGAWLSDQIHERFGYHPDH